MENSSETLRDLRKKLKRAIESRDTWKNKQGDKQYQLKIIKSKLHSALDSRENWKKISRINESKLAELKQEVDEQNKKIQDHCTQKDRLAMENEQLKKNSRAPANGLGFGKNT